MVQVFSDVIWWWVVAIILLTRVGLLLVTIRWKLLLAELGISLPALSLYKRVWIGQFFNNFLPGRIGADVYRVFGPWEMTLEKTVVGGSVVFDRVTGLIGLLIVVSAVGLVEHDVARDLGLGLLPVFTMLAAVVLLAMVTVRGPLGWTLWLVPRCPSAKAGSVLKKFLESTLIYVDRKGTTLRAVAISVVFPVFNWSRYLSGLSGLWGGYPADGSGLHCASGRVYCCDSSIHQRVGASRGCLCTYVCADRRWEC